MEYSYKTRGTCAREIRFEVNDGRVQNIRFVDGCSGNTQGVAALAEGMSVEKVIARLKGIRCGFKPTSCPDQLARALEQTQSQGA